MSENNWESVLNEYIKVLMKNVRIEVRLRQTGSLTGFIPWKMPKAPPDLACRVQSS